MSYRKYLKDYRVDACLDGKGRLKSEAVYVGGGYALRPAVPVGEKRKMLAACALSWPALVGALVPVSRAARTMYIVVPFAASALPLFLATCAASSLMFAGEPMTRRKAEGISRNLPANALIVSVLSGAAFLGFAVMAFLNWSEMLFGDTLFGALSLLTAAAALFAYRKSRKLKACNIDAAADETSASFTK